MDEQYTCCPNHTRTHLALSADEIPSEYNQTIEALIKKIWDEKQAGKPNQELISAYGKSLSQAVDTGFENSGNQIKSVEDKVLYDAMQTNVWRFSAAKDDAQRKQMSLALIDPKTGGIRSFEDFKRQCQQIAGMNLSWLRTEYDTAVQGALMAAKWQKIQDTKHLFPLLKYVAVSDDVTSDLCNSLDGVVKPVDDPFWVNWFPPNHFNCRSDVEQGRADEWTVTPDDKIVIPNFPKGFKKNTAITGEIFDLNKAYNNIERSAEQQDIVIKAGDAAKRVHDRDVFTRPREEQFVTVYQDEKTGGKVDLHLLARPDYNDPMDDFLDLIDTAKQAARQGYQWELLPIIEQTGIEARKAVLTDFDHPTANPDIRDILTGEYLDLKRPKAIKNILENANKAATKQNAIALISDALLDADLTEQTLVNRIKGIFSEKNKENYRFDSIYFYVKGMLKKYNRQ